MIVCLDTNIVIYLIESHPTWAPKATTRIGALRSAGDEIAVCDAARLECLVKPLASGNATDIATYRSFFASPQVRMLTVSANAWERAAGLAATW